MSRKPHVPTYRLHRQSGQAIVTLNDSVTGQRKDYLLGKHDTKASKEEYERIVLAWQVRGRRLPQPAQDSTLSIAELIARYWKHVEEYYSHVDGSATGEVQAMRYALRPLNHLHGSMPAGEFGPSALKAVRELMVNIGLPPFYVPGAVRVGSTVTDVSSARRSAAESGRGHISPNSAGVPYPSEL
jgi:hypothetical protein